MRSPSAPTGYPDQPSGLSALSAAMAESLDARVYSGIHFRKADVDGAALGEAVARDGLEHNFERD